MKSDTNRGGQLAALMAGAQAALLEQWTQELAASNPVSGRIGSDELRTQCAQVLSALSRALEAGGVDIQSPAFEPLKDRLAEISRSRAAQGFSPSETALFLFSLKRPVFDLLRARMEGDAQAFAEQSWSVTLLLDGLGLYTIEVYQQSRDEIVLRQQEEIAELSTPVVKLWEGILALPLIGTLDSARTQVVMENLLQAIVDQGAEIAIIDITGVPTVDTLVAQHLLKTISAARLMGADCIVSGIRPQIAQTMVHLGVELNVTSKSTLADAFVLALQQTGRTVVRTKAAMPVRA